MPSIVAVSRKPKQNLTCVHALRLSVSHQPTCPCLESADRRASCQRACGRTRQQDRSAGSGERTGTSLSARHYNSDNRQGQRWSFGHRRSSHGTLHVQCTETRRLWRSFPMALTISLDKPSAWATYDFLLLYKSWSSLKLVLSFCFLSDGVRDSSTSSPHFS
jgi:hypothetical protein